MSHSSTERSQSRNQKAGTEFSFLACSPWLLNLLSCTAQDHLLVGGQYPQWVDLPISIINQEKAPEDTPKGQYDGGNPSAEVPSYQMTLACVGLIKAEQHAFFLQGPDFHPRKIKGERDFCCWGLQGVYGGCWLLG